MSPGPHVPQSPIFWSPCPLVPLSPGLPMPNAQCPIPHTQFPIPNSQCPIPN
ncbi:MAG: hypothetical protein F6J93_09395 [Oscillatoria sp. SIO1A7]|nr:hypothetical protein [Oscillatoria sp. SIO1A7]